MKFKIRKLMAMVLALSMVLSVPVFASEEAVELTEERRAFLEESGRGEAYSQEMLNAGEVPELANAVDADSPLKDYKEPEYYKTTKTKTINQDGYYLTVSYMDSVPYSGKSHVGYSSKRGKSNQYDLNLSAYGSVTGFATVKYSYKYNKNAADSQSKKAPRIVVSLKAKKKATKAQKKIVKKFNKALKKTENRLTFSIVPLDVSTLDPKVKFGNKAKTKVKSVSVKYNNKTLTLKGKDFTTHKYNNDTYIKFKGNYCGFWSENIWLNSGYKTVNFVTNCDTKIEPLRVKYGTVLSQPAVSKEKSELKGWFKNEAMTQTQQFYFYETVTKDMTLYARWIKVVPDYMNLYASRDTVLNDSSSDKSKVDFFLDTDVEVDSIDLYRNGTKINSLRDDGRYSYSGDELAGDGIFSTKVSGKIPEEGDAVFKAVYNYSGNSSESDPVTVKYVDPFTQEELTGMDTVNTSIEDFVNTAAFKTNTIEQNVSTANEKINQMISDGNVESGSVNREGNILTFTYSSGVKGGIPLVDISNPGTPSNGASILSEVSEGLYEEVPDGTVEEMAEIPEETEDELAGPEAGVSVSDEIMDITEEEGKESAPEAGLIVPASDEPESQVPELQDQTSTPHSFYGKALILNSFPAFETEPEDIAYRTNFYSSLKNTWDGYGMTTTLKDSNVTVDDYKGFADYDVVDIATHGSAYGNEPAICLAEKATQTNNDKYALELNSGEIVQVGNRYWILPKFFENEYALNSLGRTFVFSESCMFMGHGQGAVSTQYNTSMADAITGRGCPVVIGDHNSVFATYIRKFMATYVEGLVDAKTAGDAFNAAQTKWGSNHKIWFENNFSETLLGWWLRQEENKDKTAADFNENEEIAYPFLVGDPNARLLSNALENGNFEKVYTTGSITRPTAWSYEGDGRAVTKLGDVLPKNHSSKWMGLVTSGIGSQEKTNTIGIDGNGTEGSRMFQTVKIPSGASEMTFDYNFVSEEPMEYVGSSFDDSFAVVISQGDSILYSKIFASVNTSTWYEIGGVDFEGGDMTAYETGWFNGKVDMSGFRNQTVTISFLVFDKGDKIYDSACLLDDVVLK